MQVALPHMFSIPNAMEIILHHCLQFSVLKTLAHFISSPPRNVKTDWPYSKDRASLARTSSVNSDLEQSHSIYGQDGPTGYM